LVEAWFRHDPVRTHLVVLTSLIGSRVGVLLNDVLGLFAFGVSNGDDARNEAVVDLNDKISHDGYQVEMAARFQVSVAVKM